MEPREVIRRKRDGEKMGGAEIAFMVRGIADGSIGEGQVAAFAMAVFLRGMDHDERVTLTREMTASGRVLDWTGAGLGGRPVLDKHSTGGTVDKLDAIPGYATAPDTAFFRAAVREAGCAIIVRPRIWPRWRTQPCQESWPGAARCWKGDPAATSPSTSTPTTRATPAAAAGGRLPGHPRLRRPALLRHQHRRRVCRSGNELGFTRPQLTAITRTAIEAAFADAPAKQRLRARLEQAATAEDTAPTV